MPVETALHVGESCSPARSCMPHFPRTEAKLFVIPVHIDSQREFERPRSTGSLSLFDVLAIHQRRGPEPLSMEVRLRTPAHTKHKTCLPTFARNALDTPARVHTHRERFWKNDERPASPASLFVDKPKLQAPKLVCSIRPQGTEIFARVRSRRARPHPRTEDDGCWSPYDTTFSEDATLSASLWDTTLFRMAL